MTRWAIFVLVLVACGSGPRVDGAPPTAATTAAAPSVSEPVETTVTSLPSPSPTTTAVVPSTTTATAPPPTVGWSSARLEDAAPVTVNAPVALLIPGLDIRAPIIALGVEESTGLMEVPDNVSEVGWYRHGPAPGAEGSAVLAAHVDMRGQGPGVFFDLDRLGVGDTFAVEFADGAIREFEVTESDRVPKSDLDVESLFMSSGDPVVRLVTCGGAFNDTIRSYADNVVVTGQELDQ